MKQRTKIHCIIAILTFAILCGFALFGLTALAASQNTTLLAPVTPKASVAVIVVPEVTPLVNVVATPVVAPTPAPTIQEVVVPPKPQTEEEIINGYVYDICTQYNVDQYLIRSIIYQESRYQPNAHNGNCPGLMQISTYWHRARAEQLGVTDFYDPYSNILLGVDFLSELFNDYHDTSLVLMLYNQDWDTAFVMHRAGQISDYAWSVMTRAETLKQEAS